jgi:DNA replication protein DnaC
MLKDFNHDLQPVAARDVIAYLCTGTHLHEGRNIALVGPLGAGKIQFAIGMDAKF